MAYDPQLVVVLRHEISKAHSYGSSSSSGSLGRLSDEEYDRRIDLYHKRRRKQMASSAALGGAASAGGTAGLNLALGHRGKKLLLPSAIAGGVGAAFSGGIGALAGKHTDRRLRRPEYRRMVEENMGR